MASPRPRSDVSSGMAVCDRSTNAGRPSSVNVMWIASRSNSTSMRNRTGLPPPACSMMLAPTSPAPRSVCRHTSSGMSWADHSSSRSLWMSSSVSGPVVMSRNRCGSGSVAVIKGAFRGRLNTQHPVQVGQLEYRGDLPVRGGDAQIPPGPPRSFETGEQRAQPRGIDELDPTEVDDHAGASILDDDVQLFEEHP